MVVVDEFDWLVNIVNAANAVRTLLARPVCMRLETSGANKESLNIAMVQWSWLHLSY